MISQSEARQLAIEKMRELEMNEGPFALKDEATIERSFGWVFFYNSKEFLETGNFLARLAGNGPLIVNKYTGDVVAMGTNKPPQVLIDDYERSWKSRGGETEGCHSTS